MKLIELINSTPAHEIVAACGEIDPKNANGYAPLLDKLKEMTPGPPEDCAEWTIVLAFIPPIDIPPIDEDDEGYVDVSGRKAGDDTNYAIEFTPWSAWLIMDIQLKNVDLTPAQIVGHCMNEMTWMGWDPEMIQDRLDHLIEATDKLLEEFEHKQVEEK